MNSISWLLIETSINECDVVDPPRDTEGIEVSHYLLQVDSGSGMFCMLRLFVLCASFAAFLTLLVGRQEGYPAYKKISPHGSLCLVFWSPSPDPK